MLFWSVVDVAIFIALAACVFFWPTQLISDDQNRWLRIVAVGVVAMQLIGEGPRLQLLPAYLIAGLFALLLIPRGSADDEPSAVRESKESRLKKAARWAIVVTAASLLLASIFYTSLSPRV